MAETDPVKEEGECIGAKWDIGRELDQALLVLGEGPFGGKENSGITGLCRS